MDSLKKIGLTVLNLLTLVLYFIGLISPLTPSEGVPSAFEIFIFVGIPLLFQILIFKITKSKKYKIVIAIEFLLILISSFIILIILKNDLIF